MGSQSSRLPVAPARRLWLSNYIEQDSHRLATGRVGESKSRVIEPDDCCGQCRCSGTGPKQREPTVSPTITNPQIFFRFSIVGVAGAGPPMVFRRAPTTDGLKIRGYVSTFVVLIPAPVPRTTRVPTA